MYVPSAFGGRCAPAYPQPPGPSTRVAAIAACVLAVSCGDGAPPRGAPEPRPAPPPLDEAAAWTVTTEALEAEVSALAERASRAEATGEGVATHREVARLARVLALRDARGDWSAVAQRSLEEASRRKGLPGACDAALDLSRLLARDVGDLEAAFTVAYRTARRFGAVPETDECVRDARRITTMLDAYRPSAAVLAVIDADPDAGDPSAGMQADPVSRWAAEQGAEGTPTLERVAVYGAPDPGSQDAAGGVVRVVLHFDRVAVFERGELAAEGGLPRRAYLDFAAAAVAEAVPDSMSVGAGGVQRVRRGRPRPEALRVVFDIEDDARYRVFFLTDPYRLVIDFERAGVLPLDPLAPGAARLRTIVLDPGHGGNDYGARHSDLEEKHLALDITRRVATLLEQRLPDARVLMTRNRDEFIGLEERTAYANSVGADIFVSIHLNAADDEVERGGVATFVLDIGNERQALRFAARENGTSTRDVTGLQRILAHLHRGEQVGESRRLAELVQAGTLRGAREWIPRMPDRGVKSAMFYVLVGARMPAILVEASFVNQPDEARLLRTERYRQSLADGIAEGIVRYGRM